MLRLCLFLLKGAGLAGLIFGCVCGGLDFRLCSTEVGGGPEVCEGQEGLQTEGKRTGLHWLSWSRQEPVPVVPAVGCSCHARMRKRVLGCLCTFVSQRRVPLDCVYTWSLRRLPAQVCDCVRAHPHSSSFAPANSSEVSCLQVKLCVT